MSELFQRSRLQIKRFLWDLERFGVTSRKVRARLSNRAEPRIMLISVPKAGTHLLERALCLHPRLYRPIIPTLHPGNIENFGGLANIIKKLRTGTILVSHLHYSQSYYDTLKQANVKGVFVVRDPRDIVVSRAFYVARTRKHPYHQYVAGMPMEEQLLRAIIGDPKREYPPIRETLERFSGWIDKGLLVLRFEDLIATQSRGNAIQQLYEYVNLDVSDKMVSAILSELVSEASPTFRAGKVGGWANYLKDDIYRVFLDEAGDLMERYGYG